MHAVPPVPILGSFGRRRRPLRRARTAGHRRRVVGFASAFGLAAAIPFAAAAQPTTSEQRAATEQVRLDAEDAAERRETRALTSDLLLRLSFERLRQIDNPAPADYAVAAWTVRAIQPARPDDAELVRYEIAAWNAAGDRERALEATRRLTRLDPSDAVAQLRLIAAAIEGRQTADERLAAYERLLGSDGAGLDVALRSRLALDAALLAREMGDADRFVELLTEAVTLDRTNKAAAILFATVFLDRAQSPLERVEILSNVVLADPLDPEAYANLYTEYMQHGAYASARRFLERRVDALSAGGATPNSLDIVDSLHLDWQVAGVDEMLLSVAGLQRRGDMMYRSDRENMLADDIDPGPFVAQLMSPRIELARLIALVSLGPDADGRAFRFVDPAVTIEEAVADARRLAAQQMSRWELAGRREEATGRSPGLQPMTPDEAEDFVRDNFSADETPSNIDFGPPAPAPLLADAGVSGFPFSRVRAYNRTIAAIDQALGESAERLRERGADQAAIDRRAREYRLERVWSRLFMAADIDQAERELEAVIEAAEAAGEPLGAAARDRFIGWIAALRNQPERARESLAALEADDASARWALAVLDQHSGAEREAARRFLLLMRDQPDSMLAAAARERAESLLGVRISPTETASRLDDYGRRFAPWLDSFTRQPRLNLSLTTAFETLSVGALGHPRLTLTLRNTSPSPLSLGTGRTVPSRVLLTPEITVGSRQIPQDLVREFATLARQRLDVSAERADQLASQQIRELAQRLLEVAEFDRRLRLEPQQQVSITIWPARGYAGTWLAQDALSRTAVRWRATHGFAPSARGLAPTPISITAETELLVREALPAIDERRPIDLSTPGRPRLLDVLRIVSRLSALRSREGLTGQAEADDLRETLTAALPNFTPDEAAFTLARLVEAGLIQAGGPDDPLLPAFQDALGEPADEHALLTLLLFVPASHAWALDLGLASDDEAVRAIAEMVASAAARRDAAAQGADDADADANERDADAPPSK